MDWIRSYDEIRKGEEAQEKKSKKMRCYNCKALFTAQLKPKNEEVYEEYTSPSSTQEDELFSQQTSDERELLCELLDHVEKVESSKDSMVNQTSQWTLTNTLDLSEYKAKKRMSLIAFVAVMACVCLLVMIGFFAFVASQNDWTLSFSEIDGQISNSFFVKYFLFHRKKQVR